MVKVKFEPWQDNRKIKESMFIRFCSPFFEFQKTGIYPGTCEGIAIG